MKKKSWQPKLYKNYQWIVQDPDYMGGTLSIKDTRMPVYLILQCLGEGMDAKEISKTYTKIPKDAFQEIMALAAEEFEKKNVAS